jgi:hypothetical protein
MATIGGTNIVRDGAILIIDPGSSRCFNDGDTTCNNLVTGGGLLTGPGGVPGTGTHIPTTTNFPAYNYQHGGIFAFAGGKGMNVEADLGTATAASICIWLYADTTASQYITDGRNDGGIAMLANHVSFNIHWDQLLTYIFEDPFNASASNFLNKWLYVVAVSDASNSRLYINGIEVLHITGNSTTENFGKNFRIGTPYNTGGSRWSGYMGPIQLYNRRLTAAEIYQNYGAYRNRFEKGLPTYHVLAETTMYPPGTPYPLGSLQFGCATITGADRYWWYYKLSSNSTWLNSGNSSQPNWTYNNLAYGTSYDFMCIVRGTGTDIDSRPSLTKTIISGDWDSDAQTYFTNTSMTDSVSKNAVHDMITSLKAQNHWNYIQFIYPFLGTSASSWTRGIKTNTALLSSGTIGASLRAGTKGTNTSSRIYTTTYRAGSYPLNWNSKGMIMVEARTAAPTDACFIGSSDLTNGDEILIQRNGTGMNFSWGTINHTVTSTSYTNVRFSLIRNLSNLKFYAGNTSKYNGTDTGYGSGANQALGIGVTMKSSSKDDYESLAYNTLFLATTESGAVVYSNSSASLTSLNAILDQFETDLGR